MTPAEVREARAILGMTQEGLAAALELEGEHRRDTVKKWEAGLRPMSGPARVAIRLMLKDHARRAARRAKAGTK